MNGKAIIYIRFSTKAQELGDSKRRQTDDCKEYCLKERLDVVEVVEDLGRSAYKGDHLTVGNLGKLTARIQRGDIEPGTTLVVEKLDRLSRQKPRVIQRWIEDVCDKGIRIARTAGGPIIDAAYLDDGSNIAAMIELAYMSNAGHEYSRNISERLSSSWNARRAKALAGDALLTASAPRWLEAVGEWKGKNLPDHRNWRIIPERGETVRLIYEYAADGVGTWGIAKLLNEKGIAPWGKRSETSTRDGWNHSSIKNVLTSPAVEGIHYPTSAVSGKRQRTGEVLRNYYPLIEGLNADLIARARAQMSKRAGGAPKTNHGKNLLASLARCGSCGGFMTMRNRGVKDGPYAYLQCNNASLRKGCNANGMFNYRKLEPAILDAVLHLTLDDSFFSIAGESNTLRIQLAEVDSSLIDKKEERDNVRALLRRFPDDEQLVTDWQGLSQTVRDLEERRIKLAAELAEANGSISAAEHLKRVHNFRFALDDEDVDVRRTARLRVREAFRSVISFVTCNQSGGNIPEKCVDVALASGLIGFRFDNEGQIIHRFDFRNSPDHIHGQTASKMSENAEVVEAILRRS